MDLLAVILLWPFMVLAAGLVFVVFGDLFDLGGIISFPGLLLLGIALLVVRGRASTLAEKYGQNAEAYQVYLLRRSLLVFSIALLFPTFIRYFVDSMDKALAAIILALVLAFGFIIWGVFAKSRTTIMYSNIIGGGIALFYLYVQLWDLGEGARIVAAAFGLVVAIAVSIIKLRERIT